MTLALRVAARFAALVEAESPDEEETPSNVPWAQPVATNMGSPDGSHSKDFAQKIRSKGEKNEEEARAEAWIEHKTAAGLPANHLMKNPAGTWSFVGGVDARLGYLRKDGTELTGSPEDDKLVKDAASFGPGLVGLRPRVYKTPHDAFVAAKKLGLTVTLAQWEMDKFPEIAEGLKHSGVKHKINP